MWDGRGLGYWELGVLIHDLLKVTKQAMVIRKASWILTFIAREIEYKIMEIYGNDLIISGFHTVFASVFHRGY